MNEHTRSGGAGRALKTRTMALTAFLLLFLPVLSSCIFTEGEPDPSSAYRELTIYHVNDPHSHLDPLKDTADGIYYGGASRLKTLLNGANRNKSIFLTAGDFVQGTLYYNFFHGAAEVEVFNAMGVDAACPGNHEFDGGTAQLESYFSKTAFPLLCSNIVFKTSPSLAAHIKPYAVIEKNGIKIAVIGADTHELIEDSPKLGTDIAVDDPSAAVKKLASELRGGVDLVVALTHIGHDADLKLASEAEGLDIIIGGHSHTAVERPIAVAGRGGVCYVAQAGAYMKYLGWLKLGVAPKEFVRPGAGRFVFEAGGLTPIEQSIAPDAAVEAIVKKYSGQIGQEVKKVIAHTAVELVGTRDIARSRECNLGNLYADALLERTGADLALVNGGTFRQSITGPEISVESVLNASPYDSIVAIINVSGGDILEDLKMTFARADGVWGGFLQVSRGVRIAVDNGTLISATLNGSAIDPLKTYKLATSDYIANGGDGHSRYVGKNPDLGAMLKTNDVVIEYIKNLPQPVNYTVEGRLVITGTAAGYINAGFRPYGF